MSRKHLYDQRSSRHRAKPSGKDERAKLLGRGVSPLQRSIVFTGTLSCVVFAGSFQTLVRDDEQRIAIACMSIAIAIGFALSAFRASSRRRSRWALVSDSAIAFALASLLTAASWVLASVGEATSSSRSIDPSIPSGGEQIPPSKPDTRPVRDASVKPTTGPAVDDPLQKGSESVPSSSSSAADAPSHSVGEPTPRSKRGKRPDQDPSVEPATDPAVGEPLPKGSAPVPTSSSSAADAPVPAGGDPPPRANPDTKPEQDASAELNAEAGVVNPLPEEPPSASPSLSPSIAQPSPTGSEPIAHPNRDSNPEQNRHSELTADAAVDHPLPENSASASPSPRHTAEKPPVDSVEDEPPVGSLEASNDENAVEKPRPILLPAGTRMTCRALKSDLMVSYVEQSPSTYLRGITAKDFLIADASGKPVDFTLFYQPIWPRERTCSIAFLLDQSVKPVSDRQAMQQVIQDITASAPHAHVQAIAFGRGIHILTPWTQDHERVHSLAHRLSHSHGASLSTAISIAIDDLSERSGRRLLVVFSDGIDRTLDDKAMVLERRCIRHQVEVIVVDLPGHRDDEAFLGRLVAKTKGERYGVHQGSQIAEWVREWSTEQMTPYYGFLLATKEARWPLTVSLGSGATRLTQHVQPKSD